MLDKDPTKRYTLNQIRNHKWMLISESALQLKIDLAKQGLKRKLDNIEEEKISPKITIHKAEKSDNSPPARLNLRS